MKKQVSAFETTLWFGGMVLVTTFLLWITDGGGIENLHIPKIPVISSGDILLIIVGFVLFLFFYWFLLIAGARWNRNRIERINMMTFGNKEGKLNQNDVIFPDE